MPVHYGNVLLQLLTKKLHCFNHQDAGNVHVLSSKAGQQFGWHTRVTRIGQINTTIPEEHRTNVKDRVQEDFKSPGIEYVNQVETIRRNTEDNRL